MQFASSCLGDVPICFSLSRQNRQEDPRSDTNSCYRAVTISNYFRVTAARELDYGRICNRNDWFFDVFWWTVWLFLMVAWFWVVISVVADIFRSKDINGLTKGLWVAFVIVIPWLGVLSYIILRGDKMDQHRIDTTREIQQAHDLPQ